MNIACHGSSLVSAYWNGAATYYRGLLRALAGLGHVITFFEPDAYGRQERRDLEAPDFARVVVYPATPAGARWAVEESRSADVVLKASGVGVNDALLEEGVLSLQGPRTLVVYWDVDAPATLDRLAADPADPLRGLIPRFDLVLTYGGGPPVAAGFARLGAKACVPVHNGLDPAEHRPVRPDPRFAADLSFLGNRLPDRESRVDAFFLEAAARLPRHRFLLGGAGWDDKPTPANVRKLGHVPTAAHNVLNCSAKAVLNINRESMARYGWSPATRVFEAAGAGACLITDEFAGLADFFEPGREILTVRNGEEVADLVKALTPARARAIGLAARRRALADHGYAKRAEPLHDILTGRAPGRGRAA